MFLEIAAKVLHQQFIMLCVVLLCFLSPLQITLPAYLLHTIDITCTVRTSQCHSSMYNGCIYESASRDATLLPSHCKRCPPSSQMEGFPPTHTPHQKYQISYCEHWYIGLFNQFPHPLSPCTSLKSSCAKA